MNKHLSLHLQRLRLERGGRVVLRDIDWRIRPGQRWMLIGANGAGKTQLLKILAGDVWPTPTGRELRRYRWRGETFDTPYGVKEEIAYLGAERQDRYERHEWNFSVEQIVGTGLYRTDTPLDALTVVDRRRVAALLRRFDMGHLAARRFLTLSYGERRLVLLARALATRPQLLLLDEPFNGLDQAHGGILRRWLVRSTASALPWVLATHRADEVPASATHAAVLEEGRWRYRGVRNRAPLRCLSDAVPLAPSPAPGVPRGKRNVLVRLAGADVYLDGVHVLRNLSFEIGAGECWVVHGANGSGKTTLLRAIHGDHGIAGEVWRAGIEPGVPLERFRQQVGWISPQLQSRFPRWLPVAEVVQSGRHASIGLHEPLTAADRPGTQRALNRFGLAHLAGRIVGELSYGQMRRVLFARAWVHRPRLLLLDEPYAGVDAPTRARLMADIEQLIAQGVTVMMAAHHRDEWPRSISHELRLSRGAVEFCGPSAGAARR